MKVEPHQMVFVKNKLVLHFPDGTNEIHYEGSSMYNRYREIASKQIPTPISYRDRDSSEKPWWML